ncbi:MBL fold metallo-hydrolase [Actinomadura barringtoniae]|uniref:MBL fold metallo-hydrolase n=1 Tax=Actinomadura barringtoniae TaxID=1427535 RepID=A0A939TD42_9ACTN|nr:MBL fold metallo-hydrolase [Actinomadura barringtoniae]MBO2451915.1 MBL fold metallo-hydrolase [Actinomadura barringtoniae]
MNVSEGFRELAVPPGMVGVCALGQAGFLIKGSGGTVVAVDPYLSDRLATDSEFGPPGRWARRFPPPFGPGELDADVVVITHEHADHFDPVTLGPAFERHPFQLVAPPVLADDATRLGAAFRPAHAGEPLEVGGVLVHPVPAAHSPEYTGPACYDVMVQDGAHRFLGYVIEVEDGVTVYHAGDTVLHPEIDRALAGLRPRVALLPVNGRDRIREEMGIVGNLTVREAAHLAAQAGARWLMPSHHDLFAVNAESVTTFVDTLDRQFPDQEYLVPKVGRPVVLGV